jgi:hypothetical protein
MPSESGACARATGTPGSTAHPGHAGLLRTHDPADAAIGHGIREPRIGDIVAKLEQHGMTALGEQQAVTIEVRRAVLEAAA